MTQLAQATILTNSSRTFQAPPGGVVLDRQHGGDRSQDRLYVFQRQDRQSWSSTAMANYLNCWGIGAIATRTV